MILETEERTITFARKFVSEGNWNWIAQELHCREQGIRTSRFGAYRRVGRLLVKVYWENIRSSSAAKTSRCENTEVVEIFYRRTRVFKATAPLPCDLSDQEPKTESPPQQFSCAWQGNRPMALLYVLAACQLYVSRPRAAAATS